MPIKQITDYSPTIPGEYIYSEGGEFPGWDWTFSEDAGTWVKPAPNLNTPTQFTIEDIKNRSGYAYDPIQDKLVSDFKDESLDPNAYYTQLARDLAEASFNKSGFNQDSSEYDALIESLKDVNPQAYYTAKIDTLSRAAGNNYINNEMGRMDTINNQIKALLPEAQKAGVTPEQINSIYGSGSSYGAQAGRQYLNNLQEQGGGYLTPLVQGLKVVGPALLIPFTAGASAALSGALAGTIGTAAAGVVAPALIGAATSAGFAALSGQDVGKAALTGAIGGSVGGGINTFGIDAAANLVGGGDAIMGMAKLSEVANNLGMTTSQVSDLISSALSTELSGLATGADPDKLLDRVTNNLAATALGNYAGNLTQSFSTGDLSRAANAVGAITKIGVNSALNGQDLQTSLVNNIGQIIGAASQEKKYTDISKLFNSDGSISTSGLDEINRASTQATTDLISVTNPDGSSGFFNPANNTVYNADGTVNSAATTFAQTPMSTGKGGQVASIGADIVYGNSGGVGNVQLPRVDVSLDPTFEAIREVDPSRGFDLTVESAKDLPLSPFQIEQANELERRLGANEITLEEYNEGLARIENENSSMPDFGTAIDIALANSRGGRGNVVGNPRGSGPLINTALPDSGGGPLTDPALSSSTSGGGGPLTDPALSSSTSGGGGGGTSGGGGGGTGAGGGGGTGAGGGGGTGAGGGGGTGTGGDKGGTGTGGGGSGGSGGSGGTTTVTNLPSMQSASVSSGGALPGNLQSTSLAAAPVQESSMNLQQLKQLYPQLSTIDPKLLQTLMGRASATSAMGAGGEGGATGLSAIAQGGKPSAGYPAQAASNTSSTNFASTTPMSGSFDALSSAGLRALSGATNPYGLKDGGQPHVPQFKTGTTGHYVQGEGDGQSDDIPAMLADGEYVFDADTVAALGNGSNKAGALQLDRMRQEIRKHKRSAPHNKIPPKAKSPLEYMKGK